VLLQQLCRPTRHASNADTPSKYSARRL
jgi:hypothetical protein